MSSGDTLAVFFPQNGEAPASNHATLDLRNGVLVLDYDDTVDESMEFAGLMPRHYSGGGITITIGWMSTDVTITGGHECRWDVAFKSVSDDADDLDTKSFAAANSVSSGEASASGEVKYITITFTGGADMDSVAAGEYFRLELTRDADHADDDLTDDAELVFLEIKET